MSLVICATGNIVIGGIFNILLQKHFNVWGNTKRVFDTSHLVFGNLNTCIGSVDFDVFDENKNTFDENKNTFDENKNVFDENKNVFNLKSEYAGILREIPFDYLSIANNHVLDYQTIGLRETLTNLGVLNIMTSGAGLTRYDSKIPAIFRIKILDQKINKKELSVRRIAVFSAADCCDKCKSSDSQFGIYYINQYEPENAMDYFQYYKSHHPNTFIILNFNWKCDITKYKDEPNLCTKSTKSTEMMQMMHYFAVKMFESGVDLILGHSNDIGEFEKIKNKYVFYSLGSFINNYNNSNVTEKNGLIARININLKTGMVETIDNYATSVLNSQVNV
jgi:hypothetical protein